MTPWEVMRVGGGGVKDEVDGIQNHAYGNDLN